VTLFPAPITNLLDYREARRQAQLRRRRRIALVAGAAVGLIVVGIARARGGEPEE
jgi:Tfp pilus assembly protein PilN